MLGHHVTEHRKIATLGIALVASVVLFAVRTSGISNDYWLMNDQIRDWDLVQTSFGSLPVTGTPRSGGGYHVGPAYYHLLWGSRVVLSPFLGNLPHVAGMTVTALDVAGALALSWAIWRIGTPFLVAAAAGVLLATAPYSAALSRAGWNPAVALALSNLALALFLRRSERWSVLQQALLTALCWMAVEMHLAAFPLAICLTSLAAVRPSARGRRPVLLVATSALVVITLQLPALVVGWPADAGAESSLSLSVTRLFANPAVLLHPRGFTFVTGEGMRQLLRGVPFVASSSMAISLLAMALVAGATLTRRVEWFVGLATLGPLLLAAAAFTVLDRALEAYWLVPSLGIYALVLALPFTLVRDHRWRQLVAAGFMLAVVAGLPARWGHFAVAHRYGMYGPLVAAAARLAKDGPPVRALIGPADDVRPTAASPLVRWQGGTLSHAAPVVARMAWSGEVRFVPTEARP